MSKDIEQLLKLESGDKKAAEKAISLETSKGFSQAKRKINAICRGFCMETDRYKPEISARSIQSYLNETKKIDRMLYSEISNYIFSRDVKERATFASNIEKLLLYVLNDENKISVDCRKMSIKIYDHFQLVLYQIENINNIFADGIEEARLNLKKEVKGIEKEYISILGIFASIVLAFVGGITFSSSVLQNISNSSIYRLLLVIDLLAFILVNVIHILVKFILMINESPMQGLNIGKINSFCWIFGFIIVFAWLLNMGALPGYLEEFLPWCNP